MTGPEGNSEFCFPRLSMFPETKSRELASEWTCCSGPENSNYITILLSVFDSLSCDTEHRSKKRGNNKHLFIGPGVPSVTGRL